MDDDFNTAAALGQLYNLVRAINQGRDAGAALGDAQNTLRELAGVLGLQLREGHHGDDDATPYIRLLVEVRDELRHQKQWAMSDQIRDRLAELGVVVEDSADGSTWHRRA
jgi:cysteinyl-tRNA synthetase